MQRASDIVLIFPPHSDSRAPFLALPSLTAFLRERKLSVVQKDVNLEALLFFLQPGNLSSAYSRLKECYRDKNVSGLSHCDSNSAKDIDGLLKIAPLLIDNIERSQAILRSQDFYDFTKLSSARKLINDTLGLIGKSYSPDIEFSLDSYAYKKKYNQYVLEDLLGVVRDSENNLFIPYYKNHTMPQILAYRPKLVGISIAHREQIIPGLTLSYMLKQSGLYVTIGGSYFTRFIDEIRNNADFFKLCDSVIVFEGENALLELLKQHKRSKPAYANVPNLIYYENNLIKVNKFITEDVNKLPAPDFNGLPLDKYFAPELVLPFALGRGCYWDKCRFCDISFSNGPYRKNRHRMRSLDNVIRDISKLTRKHHTKNFFITNECITARYLYEFAQRLVRKKNKINYVCYSRFDKGFTNRICRILLASGAKKIRLGLESCCQGVLDYSNKNYRISVIEKSLKTFAHAKLPFHLSLLVGLPRESKASANKMIYFFRRNAHFIRQPFNSTRLSVFALANQSNFYKFARHHGIIKIKQDGRKQELFRDIDTKFILKKGITFSQRHKLHRSLSGVLSQYFSSIFQMNKNNLSQLYEYDILYLKHNSDNLGGL